MKSTHVQLLSRLLSRSLSRSLGRSLGLPLALATWLPLAQSQDTHAGLRQCRAQAEAAARLACYDRLPLPTSPLAPDSPATPGAPAAAVTLPAPPVAASFGLARPEDTVQAVFSNIPGLFEGWGPKELIRLGNGQVWQVTDDSRAVYRLREPKVTVRRAPFGTFVLDIEGANQVPRVRRVQ